jgi:hypothetical protein
LSIVESYLTRYVGKMVFFRLRDKRWSEPFGLPAELFLGKVVSVDAHGVWIEWERYPLVNRNSNQRKFFKGELFIPHDNIASAFASEEFQRDVEAQADAQRLANIEPAGEG